MADFDLTIDSHPALANDPINPGQKLKDADGNPVPVWPDKRCIRYKGVLIAYVGRPPRRNISFLVPPRGLPEVVRAAAVALVKAELGGDCNFGQVPNPPDHDEDDDYDVIE